MLTTCNEVSPTFSSSRTPPPPGPPDLAPTPLTTPAPATSSSQSNGHLPSLASAAAAAAARIKHCGAVRQAVGLYGSDADTAKHTYSTTPAAQQQQQQQRGLRSVICSAASYRASVLALRPVLTPLVAFSGGSTWDRVFIQTFSLLPSFADS